MERIVSDASKEKMITPDMLKDVYNNESCVICNNKDCPSNKEDADKKYIGPYYLRDACNCDTCIEMGDDEYCVIAPKFTKYCLWCPYCGEFMTKCKRGKSRNEVCLFDRG